MGTAIALLSGRQGLIRKQTPMGFRLLYRDFHEARAEERRAALLDSLDAPSMDSGHIEIQPVLDIGLPFKPMVVSPYWSDWPSLPDLFPISFPGVKTSRDSLVVDARFDLDKLKARIQAYCDSGEVQRTGPDMAGFVQYAYRPFDTRWLYWEANSGLLDRPRPDYKPHVFKGNLALVSQQKPRREWSPPQVISAIGCIDLMDRSATCIPAWLRDEGLALDGDGAQRRPNLSAAVQRYLDHLGLGVEDLFHHALAVLHDPSYREANAGALRMEWPRIPLPGWPEGNAPGAAEELVASAARGQELAQLLDSETPVSGVTTGALRPELAAIAIPATTGGGNMGDEDFELTVGWGHFGTGDAVMPGQGRVEERSYTAEEQAALGDAMATPGGHHLRRSPERQSPVEQRSRRRLELQAGRLPGPQEVALLPGEQGPGPEAKAGRGAALHWHGAANCGGPDADWKVSCSHAVSLEGAPYGGAWLDFPARGGNHPSSDDNHPTGHREACPSASPGTVLVPVAASSSARPRQAGDGHSCEAHSADAGGRGR